VYECHFCPHRYEIGIFEFTGSAFVAAPRFNEENPYITPEKYDPYVGEGPLSSFLPEVVAMARSLVHTPEPPASR
jgi:hypothetical protein